MPPTRRNALATIAATSTLGLAGCANRFSGFQTDDDHEDNPDETEDSNGESNNELGVRTVEVNADSFESTEFTGEVTGLGNNSTVRAGIQINSFFADEWFPKEDRRWGELQIITEPGEFTWSFEQPIWGGGEYQYRAVVDTVDERVNGETKTFTLQDFDIPTPEIEFGDPSLNTENYATVEIPLENVSNVNNGVVKCDVKWFNDEGTFIGDSYGRLHAVKGGERGILTVSSYADGIEQNDIADYEYEVRYEPVYRLAEGVEVVSSSGNQGTARNTVSDPPSSVDIVVRYFNSDGVLIGDVSDYVQVPDLDAGREWEFEVSGQGEVSGEVDYSEILLLK